MPRLSLLGGAYSQASLIAGAQRSVNLYPEHNSRTSQAPVEVTHYPRPGLTPLVGPGGGPVQGPGRCLYTATNGDLYAVVGQAIYYIDPDFTFHHIEDLLTPGTTPVYISDNGVNAVVVDGSALGYNITLATRTSVQLIDPNFLGGTRDGFLDFFLFFNEPNSPNWYCTEVTSIAFNGLAFGSMTRWPGNIIALIATEDTVWLFNAQRGEVWANAGTSPFPFQPIPGTIIDHGIVGPYALAKQDTDIYWLSRSPEGARMAMKGAGQRATRISTHAIEKEWLGYARVDDCIVQTYQIRGHPFILFHFPTADRTWAFDGATDEWHEEAWYDVNGVQHRTRDTMMAYAYGKNLSLDWRTGALYQRDETNYSDNGAPVVMIRSMPHLIDEEDDRQTLWRVIADMECGNGPGVPVPTAESPWSLGFSNGFGPQVLVEPPAVTLRISRDRGFSWLTHSIQPLGSQGKYNTRPTFNRCGVATDFVVELSWEGPLKTALNGVFVVVERHEGDE